MIGQWGGPAFISACQNSVYQALNKALGKRLAFWMFMVSQDPPPPFPQSPVMVQ